MIPSIALSWVAMVVVVAFSSCLDVAAIEMEVKKPLDYNHELSTVGLSNVVRVYSKRMKGNSGVVCDARGNVRVFACE